VVGAAAEEVGDVGGGDGDLHTASVAHEISVEIRAISSLPWAL
jgi:hypothetical protein